MEGNPYHSICPIHDAMYSGFSHHLYFYVHNFLRITEVIHCWARSSWRLTLSVIGIEVVPLVPLLRLPCLLMMMVMMILKMMMTIIDLIPAPAQILSNGLPHALLHLNKNFQVKSSSKNLLCQHHHLQHPHQLHVLQHNFQNNHFHHPHLQDAQAGGHLGEILPTSKGPQTLPRLRRWQLELPASVDITPPLFCCTFKQKVVITKIKKERQKFIVGWSRTWGPSPSLTQVWTRSPSPRRELLFLGGLGGGRGPVGAWVGRLIKPKSLHWERHGFQS